MADRNKTFVLLRLRLADRPGALSAVTGRISAVRGDFVGIEVLERGTGWVVDELVIELPDPDLIDLLVREVGCEDGVVLEDAVRLADAAFDPLTSGFEVAAVIAGADDVHELFGSLCTHTLRAIRSSWVCVFDNDARRVLAEAGERPDGQTITRVLATSSEAPAGAMWMPLPTARASLVLTRAGGPFRAREVQDAAALARIADSLHSMIGRERRLRSVLSHPANGLRPGSPLLDR
ncbi:MAG: hypothetical protein OEV40_30175 [Acidimicrobiia bacterium]|nr:hypothetical protein [Acidimicrobiia bacterium]